MRRHLALVRTLGKLFLNVKAPAGAAHGNPKDYVTYGGLTLKKRSGFEYGMSKLLGGTMW